MRNQTLRSRVAAAATLALSTAVAGSTLPSPAAAAAPPRRIAYVQWDTGAELAAGRREGVRVSGEQLVLATPVGTASYPGPKGALKRYEYGRWTSPWAASGFGLTELVASWEAATPRDTFIAVQVRGRNEAGRRSSWDTLAQWAQGDMKFHRTSPDAQSDDLASVSTDTWTSNYSTEFTSWQLRVTLLRRAGTTFTPSVDTIGAMASNIPQVSTVPTSRKGVASGLPPLPVPRYSQMIHTGEYPQYGGGGEAWCSPTSVSMVLGYDKALPTEQDYAWVDPSYPQRFVDHAARMTYDYRYRGTGNWPFNTAYAASRTGHAFVTRLGSLRQAERFIKAGIPVVASIAFGYDKLTGAPIHASNGHLVVIVGFTAAGDVIVNDPAAKRAKGVRRTYDRGQFENAWLTRYRTSQGMRGSGGLAYIIRTDAQQLPVRNGATNW